MVNEALVSSLCISDNRPTHLRNTIELFLSQTYTNKEIIIVSKARDFNYESIINNYNLDCIKYYPADLSPHCTLGELRNYAINCAAGEFICIWDDDDWHRNDRIKVQMKEMKRWNKAGTILTYCILFDKNLMEAYLSFPLFPPATILCRKSVITEDMLYPALNYAEDTGFLIKLVSKNLLCPLLDPTAYIYVYHGGNTCAYEQYNKYKGHKIPKDINNQIKNILDGKYTSIKGNKIMKSKKLLAELDYFKIFMHNINNSPPSEQIFNK